MAALKGPSLDLQEAVLAVLRNSADLAGLVLDRLYDGAPGLPVFPFIVFGDVQVVPDLADCIDGSEIFPSLHIWSRDKTFAECKTVSATAWASISAAEITLSENRLLLIERSAERYLRDPDGLTMHGVLTLRALTEPL